MPSYELPLLLRQMPTPALKDSLKKIAQMIFTNGGVIRKIENLGVKPLPLKNFYNSQTHTKAAHFIFYFNTAPKSLASIRDECNRNLDIIKANIFKEVEPKQMECTLHEELLPPAYRKEVQEMLQMERQKQAKKKTYQYNSGLDYYPFQR